MLDKKLINSPLFNASLSTIFWAIQIFVAKLGLNAGADAVLFNFQSSVFALLLLSIYGLFAGVWPVLKTLSKRTLAVLIGANAIVMVFGGLFFNAGAKLTTAINVGFLTQFTTVATVLIAWVLLRERIDLPKAVTVFMLLAGTFLLVTEGRLIVPHIGDIFILISCVAWSTANVLIRKSLKNTEVPPDAATLLRPIVGLPIAFTLIMFANIYPEPLRTFFDVNIFSPDYLGYAAINGFMLTLQWIFINKSLKVSSASYASILLAVARPKKSFGSLKPYHSSSS